MASAGTADGARASARRRSPTVRARRYEAEVAFAGAPDALRRLAEHPLAGGPGRLRRAAREIHYFDTETLDLGREGLSLQIRRDGARQVLRLESRDEASAVEVSPAADPPDIAAFPDAVRARLVDAIEERPLRPLFVARLRRARRTLAFEGGDIDVVFEEGELVAEGETSPVAEVRLALKSGPPASLYRLALALTDIAPLEIAAVTRLERGLALATGVAPRAVKAGAAAFARDATLDAVIGALLKRGLDHFLANWPALASGDAAEAVHQLRVSMRRLRSLLSLLKRAFPSGELEALRADAKAIADAFGPARDWRVFSDMVQAGPAARLPEAPGLAALVAVAEAKEQEGRRLGAAALAGPLATGFVLRLQAFVAVNGWRNGAGDVDLRALGEEAAPFAAETLDRLFRRLKKRARGFEDLAAEARHEMRIALKQMRYAVDFFSALFADEAGLDKFVARASLLQDRLGIANDGAVAAELLHGLDLGGDTDLAFAAGVALGWSERGSVIDEGDLRRAWKRLRNAPRFWRDYLPAREPEPAEEA